MELEKLPLEKSRDRVIDILKESYSQGNLNLDDFEKRLSLATASNSLEDLKPLIDDLPPVTVQSSAVGGYPLINTGEVRESSVVVSVLSENTKKGVWYPPRNMTVVAVMGAAKLDFREAYFPPGTTSVSIFCLMGGIDIRVPPGVKVDATGLGIMGAFEDTTGGKAHSGAPTLKIRGLALMGGVEIKEKKQK